MVTQSSHYIYTLSTPYLILFAPLPRRVQHLRTARCLEASLSQTLRLSTRKLKPEVSPNHSWNTSGATIPANK